MTSLALEQGALLTQDLVRELWIRAETPVQQDRLISLSQRLGRFEAATLLFGWRDNTLSELLGRMDEAIGQLLAGYGRSHATLPPPSLLLALGARVHGLPMNHALARLNAELTQLLP